MKRVDQLDLLDHKVRTCVLEHRQVDYTRRPLANENTFVPLDELTMNLLGSLADRWLSAVESPVKLFLLLL